MPLSDYTPKDPQYNEDRSLVAIRYYQTTRHIVTIPTSKRQYVFVVRARICMSWVNVEDADYILNLRGGCCGRKQAGVYFYANEQSVRIWSNNGGS